MKKIALTLTLLIGSIFCGCAYLGGTAAKVTPPDELFLVARDKGANSEYGYMDKTGKLVVGPWVTFEHNGKKFGENDIYFRPRPFFEGLAGICFIDKNTDPETKSSKEFAETCGFIDKTGKVLIEPKYKKISYFSEGLAAVSPDGENWGYIDKTGKMVVEAKFYEPTSFHDGLAVATVAKIELSAGGRKWGYIDNTGKFAIEAKFDSAGSFGDGLAPVMAGSDWKIIDKTGKEITECKGVGNKPELSDDVAKYLFGDYEKDTATATSFFTNGTAIYAKKYIGKDCKTASENKNPNNKVNDADVSGLRPMSENLGLVKVFYKDVAEIGALAGVDLAADGWFFVDKDFKPLHKDSFGDARPFVEGLAAVRNRPKDGNDAAWGFVKPDMSIAIPNCFDSVGDFRAGLARVFPASNASGCSQYKDVSVSSNYLYIDKTGKAVTPQWPN